MPHKGRLALFALTILFVAGCASPPAGRVIVAEAEPLPGEPAAILVPSALDALLVPPLPDWTDRYAATNVGDMRFLNISKVMARYGLTRLEAVELQNAWRDHSRRDPDGSPDAWLDAALAEIRAGKLESGLDSASLDAAPFIVVLDLDETLYDQYYAQRAACHDVYVPAAADEGASEAWLKLAPGWERLVRSVVERGGLVILFSANLDDLVARNLAVWSLDGQPLAGHPAIAGVLTNSHLVLQEKTEGPGAENPRRGHPVVEPAKDLRVFDESLRRVIIVDDNPKRIIQLDRTRLVEKFDAEVFCSTAPGDPIHDARLRSLDLVTDEIIESVEAMHALGLDFATAYLPYTMMGRLVVDLLVDSGTLDRESAIAWVRANPAEVDDTF